MGTNSGEVPRLLVCIGVHSSVNCVSFDFLHKVDCH